MPDPNTFPNITREQAILIASRLVAAYLLLWVLDDLTLLPREILSVVHDLGPGSAWTATGASYYLRYSILELTANCFRLGLWLMAAGWFYRCGPHIRNFFAAGAE
jgi:hypothetical protein